MNKRSFTIAKRFYDYQKKRFPVFVLVLSLFPAILSSGAIVLSYPSLIRMLLAVIASLAYLLHIRIIDEHRDFDHDNTHHVNRPIQTGLISREELQKIDVIVMIALLGIAAISNSHALLLAVGMLFYSYLAGKEFFFGEKIRRYFFFYNSINLIQMLLMQVFVYFIFTNNLSLNAPLIAHFLFTTVGTIIFEFVRKLKIPGDDGTGKDTYTGHIGFSNSIVVYIVLFVINISLFFTVISLLSTNPIIWLLFSIILGLIVLLLAVVHWIKRTRFTDQLLQLSFLLSYGILNIIIYFIKINSNH